MKNLLKILTLLKKRAKDSPQRYFIPEAWNYFSYKEYRRDPKRPGEIEVSPYDFIISSIEGQILSSTRIRGDYRPDQIREIRRPGDDSGESISENIIYGMLPRAFTAWTHGDGNQISSGTFIKSLSLLPMIKELGVKIIYLLPIFEYSEKYRKGGQGSPYALKNHYKLDASLHDPLLGEGLEVLETEFKAFVEACHLLELKVMVDFVFRTASRDHDLVFTNPDWFYWIDHRYNIDFSVPKVTKERKLSYVHNNALKSLYAAKEMREYLQKFTYPPNQLNPEKWEKVKERHLRTGENILDLVEETFGITTVPGFSNMLNDPQPPWQDVTYLKYYFDLHKEARSCLGKNRGPYEDDSFYGYAPFILQDGACSNKYQGDKENLELWDYITEVIPYYQKKFQIDGARIDMGHALPTLLVEGLLRQVKEVNPDFILWSEEFQPEKSLPAQEKGFHFIIGNLWSLNKRLHQKGFLADLINHTMISALPVTAALETPDTPRITQVFQDRRWIELLIFINYFLPNSIPYINSGLELLERQPMNLGLENTEAGKFVLEKDDPMYGKLAFFDQYYFHWLNKDRQWMKALLVNASRLRSRFIKLISDKNNLIVDRGVMRNRNLIHLGYYSKETGESLILLGNKNLKRPVKLNWRRLLPKDLVTAKAISIIYADGSLRDEERPIDNIRRLGPGEVLIGLLQAHHLELKDER